MIIGGAVGAGSTGPLGAWAGGMTGHAFGQFAGALLGGA